MNLCAFSSFSEKRRLDQAVRRRTESAFRPGTKANQRSHVLLYAAFSLFLQEEGFPANPRHLLRFAEFLLRSFNAHKSVTNALASVRTFHLQCGLDVEAFEHFSVNLWKRALPATVRHVPSPAPAMPTQLLDQVCGLASSLGETGVVFAALVSLAFASLARLSSLVAQGDGDYDKSRLPVLDDLVIEGSTAWLRLKWGKCQQDAGSGYWVPMVAVPSAKSCPLRNAEALQGVLGRASPSTPLFSFPLGSGGRRGRLRHFSMRLARDYLSALLVSLGRGEEHFTFHSLRRGACTQAFAEGAVVSELQKLGGWRSDAIGAYFPASQARLRAAQCLAQRTNKC